ncbi:TPA: asparagine--tRNA ligase [Candidatus Peribacteria bacterium]|nr:asparagine--tRNA ligase [Candidatus Peribacteria bacterium]|tara:strand:- start:83 stop:1486 length:1404 start_codon:yes stop_codon:yes gene_type:complete
MTIHKAISDKKLLDTNITVKGWVRTRRDSKAGLSFIHLSDGSCFDPLQIVAKNDLPNYEEEIMHLTAGCSIIATGKLVPSKGKGQSCELMAEKIEVIGNIENPEEYPLQPKHHSFEYLREIAHLRPRTNTFGAIARARHTLAKAIHDFFSNEGFLWINTPIITASDCEGAGDMFRVSTLDLLKSPKKEDGSVDFSSDFFGREAFLTVSGQLNVECFSQSMSKVYTFGPTFRSENSNTTRHLAEFWMVEPEIAFADLSDNADLAEGLLKYIFRTLLKERPDDMDFFTEHIDKGCIDRLQKFVSSDFVRIEYEEAIKLLEKSNPAKKNKFQFPVKYGIDLQTEHERYLTEKHFESPVVVMNYPKEIKAFYMRLNDDDKTVAAMDVLAPGIGEIIGGSQREERLDVLDKRIEEAGLDKEDYYWYRDLRRYGTTPHAGFGLGFERTVVYATGMENIRDVIPFARTPGNVEF